MNKAAIKTFAVWARKKLISDIRTKAGLIGITEQGISKPLPASTMQIQYFDIGTQTPYQLTGKDILSREKLVNALEMSVKDSEYQTEYQNLLENTASAWFNRLIAIRFMEVNDYFSDHLRVLSSEDNGQRDPDLVAKPFDSDLEFTEDEKRKIIAWKMDGESEKLFQFLLMKKCNKLHEILPGIFEDENDDTEFLMALSFSEKDGVVYHLVHDVEEKDWLDQVQIIGWFYQYYNSELKDETFALLKKKVKITKERIPSATQLFTPDWIVRYMVENSLGRIWLEGHPNPTLREEWHYYLDEAEQDDEAVRQLEEIRKEYRTLTPEDIRFIDPCMGSGHILVYAFDVLMQIYEGCGYTKEDAVQSVVEKNLFGLDIDDRAYQLAYFAVMMKVRKYSRKVFRRGIKPHVYSIQESNMINRAQLNFFGASLDNYERYEAKEQMERLLDLFKDAKEYGSILSVEDFDWWLLRQFVNHTDEEGQMSLDSFGLDETQEKLQRLVEIGQVMAMKYHVTCTNPPYMGNMPIKMTKYVREKYEIEKYDLYAVFMKRCADFTIRNYVTSMITQQAWMFLSSFEELRKSLLKNTFINMLHLGARAFEEIGGEVVQTTTFVFKNCSIPKYSGSYCNLTGESSQREKEIRFLENKKLISCNQEKYELIPGSIIAYWVKEEILDLFQSSKIADFAVIKSGIVTGNNEYFLKLWFEIDYGNIGFNHKYFKNNTNIKWVPMHKGGGYRKHYGLHEYVMNLHDIWDSQKTNASVRRGEKEYYFKAGLTWSTLSNRLSVRKSPEGFVFDTKGSMCFAIDQNKLYYLEALLNSKVASYFMLFLSPTLDFNQGAMLKLPVIINNSRKVIIDELASLCVNISKKDWDSFETSWDFKTHPLIKLDKRTVQQSYAEWDAECENRFQQLKANEEELNRIFIDIYGLQDELTPEVEDKDITVRRADLGRDIRSLISYAVGCMFGRYSLEIPGLVYAGGKWPPYEKAIGVRAKLHPDAEQGFCSWMDAYGDFRPDLDNCILITDSDYFADDIVGRFTEFMKVVYGEDTLEENLNFIANALGNKGGSSREIVRNYFLKDFYKDHLKIYQNRPIYWLFDSGKQDGFKALIYMHRYDENTIGRVRVDYLHKIQERYDNEVRTIDMMQEHISDSRQRAAGEKRKEKLVKQIRETKEYDERIGHLALERISIDLDDGVKVNYAKVQKDRNGEFYQILAPIK